MKYFVIIIILFLSNVCNCQSLELEVLKKELGPKKVKALESLFESFYLHLKTTYPNESNFSDRMRKFLKDRIDQKPIEIYDERSLKKLLNLLEKSGLRKDIYVYTSEIGSYPNIYNIEQFLPTREPSLVDLEKIDDNFEDLIPFEDDLQELTDEQKLAHEERERQYEERNKKSEEYRNRRPYYNEKGLFLYSLAKSMQSDTTFMHYVEINSFMGDITPNNLSEGYLEKMTNQQLEIWYNQIPVIIDIYYWELLSRFGKK